MTPSLTLDSMLTRAALLVLSSLGITDGALPDLARVAIPPALALLLAVISVCEHRTRQTDVQATVAAADVAARAAAAAQPPAPALPSVFAGSLADQITAVGSLVESTRTGTVATATQPAPTAAPAPVPAPADPAGRHEANADYFAGNDFPTEVRGLLPAVPVPAPVN